MKKRVLILGAFVGLLALICALLLHWNKRNTQFQGRTVAEWSIAAYNGDTNAPVALRKLSPRGVALLIVLTDYREPVWRQKMRALVAKSPGFIRARYGPKLAAPDVGLVRIAAVRSLGIIGPDARASIPTLTQIMETIPNQMRTEAATALGRIGKDSLQALTQAVSNVDMAIACAALAGLGEVGRDAARAIPAMLPFMTNVDGNTRLLAGHSLTRIGPAGLLAVIDMQADGDERLQQAAAEYLRRELSSIRPPVLVLRELAHDKSPEIRCRAMKALGQMRPATAHNVRMIMAGLKDSAPAVRLDAVRALENIGGRAAVAVPELKALLQDTDSSVRAAAQSAIQRIESLAHTKPTSP